MVRPLVKPSNIHLTIEQARGTHTWIVNVSAVRHLFKFKRRIWETGRVRDTLVCSFFILTEAIFIVYIFILVFFFILFIMSMFRDIDNETACGEYRFYNGVLFIFLKVSSVVRIFSSLAPSFFLTLPALSLSIPLPLSFSVPLFISLPLSLPLTGCLCLSSL